MEQKSKEWIEIRQGRFTASECYKLMGKKYGYNLSDWTETAQSYILTKAAESFSEPMPEIKSAPISWGNEHEDEAKAYYEALFKEEIENVGFILWPENNECGCSPDGIVKGGNKGIEIKCPYTLEKHLESFLIKTNFDFKKCRPEYYWQIQMSMLCSGYDVWDFVSYHPNFNSKTRVNCIEILRDKEDVDSLKERLNLAVKIKKSIIKSIVL